MAESNHLNVPQQRTESDEKQTLKYLQFVEGTTLHALTCFTKLYGYAKDNSGPLKPSVETVEGTVQTVVGPVVDKFHGVPIELLKFVDSKVDTASSGLAKDAYTKYEPAAKDLYTKYKPAAKGLYTKYEPVAEQYAVSAWRSLNRHPLFPQVAEVVLPTAAYCSEKYNETVRSTADKGYKVATFLPLVPTEKIAKVFAASEAGTEPLVSSAGDGAVAAH